MSPPPPDSSTGTRSRSRSQHDRGHHSPSPLSYLDSGSPVSNGSASNSGSGSNGNANAKSRASTGNGNGNGNGNGSPPHEHEQGHEHEHDSPHDSGLELEQGQRRGVPYRHPSPYPFAVPRDRSTSAMTADVFSSTNVSPITKSSPSSPYTTNPRTSNSNQTDTRRPSFDSMSSTPYPSWLPRRPPPPAPASTLGQASLHYFGSALPGTGTTTAGTSSATGTPSPVDMNMADYGIGEFGELDVDPFAASVPQGQADGQLGVGPSPGTVAGGRKPTPRSVRIVTLGTDAEPAVAGIVQPVEDHSFGFGNDDVGNEFGIAVTAREGTDQTRVGGDDIASAAVVVPGKAKTKVYSRASTLPPGAFFPSSAHHRSGHDSGLQLLPRFNTKMLHLQILRSPSRWMKVYFYVWPVLVLAHVPIQTYLDFNALFVLIQLAKFPSPASSPRNWTLAAAAYIACWIIWIFGVCVLYELVYGFVRRWRIRRPLILPIYLSAPGFSYAAIAGGYEMFCFLMYLRRSAWVREGLLLLEDGVKKKKRKMKSEKGMMVHERSESVLSTSSSSSSDLERLPPKALARSPLGRLTRSLKLRKLRKMWKKLRGGLARVDWTQGTAETCAWYAQNLPTVALLLPRAGLCLAVLFAYSSSSFSLASSGVEARRDATFFSAASGGTRLTPYARGVLIANAAWTAWKIVVLLGAWLGLWITSSQRLGGLCGPRHAFDEAKMERRRKRYSEARSGDYSGYHHPTPATTTSEKETEKKRMSTRSRWEEEEGEREYAGDELAWKWREKTRVRVQDAFEFCLVKRVSVVGQELRWAVPAERVVVQKAQTELEKEEVERVLAAAGFGPKMAESPAKRGVLRGDLFDGPDEVKEPEPAYPFTKPGAGYVSSGSGSKDSVPFPTDRKAKSRGSITTSASASASAETEEDEESDSEEEESEEEEEEEEDSAPRTSASMSSLGHPISPSSRYATRRGHGRSMSGGTHNQSLSVSSGAAASVVDSLGAGIIPPVPAMPMPMPPRHPRGGRARTSSTPARAAPVPPLPTAFAFPLSTRESEVETRGIVVDPAVVYAAEGDQEEEDEHFDVESHEGEDRIGLLGISDHGAVSRSRSRSRTRTPSTASSFSSRPIRERASSLGASMRSALNSAAASASASLTSLTLQTQTQVENIMRGATGPAAGLGLGGGSRPRSRVNSSMARVEEVDDTPPPPVPAPAPSRQESMQLSDIQIRRVSPSSVVSSSSSSQPTTSTSNSSSSGGSRSVSGSSNGSSLDQRSDAEAFINNAVNPTSPTGPSHSVVGRVRRELVSEGGYASSSGGSAGSGSVAGYRGHGHIRAGSTGAQTMHSRSGSDSTSFSVTGSEAGNANYTFGRRMSFMRGASGPGGQPEVLVEEEERKDGESVPEVVNLEQEQGRTRSRVTSSSSTHPRSRVVSQTQVPRSRVVSASSVPLHPPVGIPIPIRSSGQGPTEGAISRSLDSTGNMSFYSQEDDDAADLASTIGGATPPMTPRLREDSIQLTITPDSERTPERQGVPIPSPRLQEHPIQITIASPAQSEAHTHSGSGSGSLSARTTDIDMISTAAGSFVTVPATLVSGTSSNSSDVGMSGSYSSGSAGAQVRTRRVSGRGQRQQGGMVERPGDDMGVGGNAWRVV